MSKHFKRAIKSERPILIDFYADWCEPCKQIPPILEKVKSDFKENIRIVKVNVDKNPFIASNYKVKQLPTLVLLQKGSVKWISDGMVSAPQLTSVLEKYITKNIASSY